MCLSRWSFTLHLIYLYVQYLYNSFVPISKDVIFLNFCSYPFPFSEAMVVLLSSTGGAAEHQGSSLGEFLKAGEQSSAISV